MALGQSNRNFKPRVYVKFNAKDGSLYTREKAPDSEQVVKVAHPNVDGLLKNLVVKKDEFDGKEYHKLEVYLDDEKESKQYVVEFNASTHQALELMGRMNNANVHEPMRIGGYSFPQGSARLDGTERDKDMIGVWMRQGPDFETKIEVNYGPSLGANRPAVVMMTDDDGKIVKIKGVEQIDKEATEAARAAVTASLIQTVIQRMKGEAPDESVDPEQATHAAQDADLRAAMRAKG